METIIMENDDKFSLNFKNIFSGHICIPDPTFSNFRVDGLRPGEEYFSFKILILASRGVSVRGLSS